MRASQRRKVADREASVVDEEVAEEVANSVSPVSLVSPGNLASPLSKEVR